MNTFIHLLQQEKQVWECTMYVITTTTFVSVLSGTAVPTSHPSFVCALVIDELRAGELSSLHSSW